ncbi:MAG: hypothetical protein ABSC06_19240 [Rhodopila sp.]|jgi:Xaa-Pro aminopeptidase
MAESRAFSGVTIEVVHRIKHVAHTEHGVLFYPTNGTNGTATGRTPFGDCVVHFVHDGAQSVLVLTPLKKPMLLPAGLLWRGFKVEIERFRRPA